jgi:hypothetical protein
VGLVISLAGCRTYTCECCCDDEDPTACTTRTFRTRSLDCARSLAEQDLCPDADTSGDTSPCTCIEGNGDPSPDDGGTTPPDDGTDGDTQLTPTPDPNPSRGS